MKRSRRRPPHIVRSIAVARVRTPAWRRGWWAAILAAALTLFGLGCNGWPSAAAELATACLESPTPAAAKAPRVEKLLLGHSVEGRPIEMNVFGDGDDVLLIVGGIHGDEPNGARLARRIRDYLSINPDLTAHHTVAIIPVANPDGLARGTRTNAHGVDLNRNFPSGDWTPIASRGGKHGERAASEPETQAVVRAIRQLKPTRIIDMHSIPLGYHGNNYDGPAEQLAILMGQYNEYPILPSIGYPTPGALGNWAGRDLNIATITLELPRGVNPERCWQENAGALLAAMGNEVLASSR